MQRKVALIFPKGTCKIPPFYLRGGDGLSEPENLRSQYKAALEEYNRTKKQLAQAQKEYQQTSAELEDLDECILKIASNMGQESAETTENSKLRAQIQQLKMDIEDVENQINETNQQILPFEFTGLVNERAQFTPILRDLHETIAVDRSQDIKREIGEILISEKFSESVESLIEKHVAVEVKNQMRSAVNASQNRINAQPSADTGIINEIDDQDIMDKINYLREISLDALESQVQLDLAETHHRIFLKMEIDRLEEMNEYLTLMQKETVDTQEVYDKCNEDVSDDEEQNDEENNHNQNEASDHEDHANERDLPNSDDNQHASEENQQHSEDEKEKHEENQNVSDDNSHNEKEEDKHSSTSSSSSSSSNSSRSHKSHSDQEKKDEN